VIASKLSASPATSVLLVEAGDWPVFPEIVHLADFFDVSPPFFLHPHPLPQAWANPNIAHNFNSTPQPGLNNQTANLRRAAVGFVPYPPKDEHGFRGGCTQVNAGVWFL